MQSFVLSQAINGNQNCFSIVLVKGFICINRRRLTRLLVYSPELGVSGEERCVTTLKTAV